MGQPSKESLLNRSPSLDALQRAYKERHDAWLAWNACDHEYDIHCPELERLHKASDALEEAARAVLASCGRVTR